MNVIVAFLALMVPLQDAPDPRDSELNATYDYLFSEADKEAYGKLPARNWEQNRFWHRFWRKKDPTPATPNYNEKLNLFLDRVARANEYFSENTQIPDGWKTHRGKVYILFGTPQQIRRSPFGFSSGTKYEIWIYEDPDDDSGQRRIELEFQEDDLGRFILNTQIKFPRDISDYFVLPELVLPDQP